MGISHKARQISLQPPLLIAAAWSRLLVAVVLASGLLTSSVWAAGNTITVKGSDTMVRLGQRWAEEYMHANPEVVIQVSGGGSGTGFSALINGTTDIAQASRDIKPKETDDLSKKTKTARRYQMAIDGIAIFLHESNPVKELTLDQLRRMYIGEITDWSEVGGTKGKIVLYSRENNSGTYAYFKERVLNDADFSSWTLTLPGTSAVVNAVSKDPMGVGYGGIAWAKGVKDCLVKATDTSAAIAPDVATVANGTYPISRPLFWFTTVEPNGALKNFLNWALSDAGQKVAKEAGYVPLHPEDAKKQIIK